LLDRYVAHNARLLRVFPIRFALDAMHRPQVMLLQRFARTADLVKVFAAGVDMLGLRLEAFGDDYIPSDRAPDRSHGCPPARWRPCCKS
jgi:hypothetical protein